MADIRIDTSRLTYTQFLIPELNSWFEGADAPTIRLKPGVYGFQQISGGSGPIFRFEVRPDGLIDYDPANEEFLDGRGTTTLNVRGFTITLTGGRFPTTFCQWKLGRAICPGTARTS